MSIWYILLTLLFIVVAAAMILIILVQRSQGGGLAGAFGGAGGSGTDTLFGGRVGDALTWATVVAFVTYLLLAVTLNRIPVTPTAAPAGQTAPAVTSETGVPPAESSESPSPRTITPQPIEDPTGGTFDPADAGSSSEPGSGGGE